MDSTSFMSTAKARRLTITAGAAELQVDRATFYSWGRLGILGPNGARVILKLTKIGGRLWVYESDIEEFIGALNSPAIARAGAPASASTHDAEAKALGL